jgi:hypothetical protein
MCVSVNLVDRSAEILNRIPPANEINVIVAAEIAIAKIGSSQRSGVFFLKRNSPDLLISC